MTDESLYKDGEEEFGSVSSIFYSFLSKFLRRNYAEIDSDLRSERFKTLLDVGCGPGNLDILLAESHPEATLYCVDPSPAMLSIAKGRISRANLEERITASLGSSRNIPFEGKFDVIISSFSYHHWNRRDDSLNFLASRLNNGGLIAIYEYHTSQGLFSTSHGISDANWASLELSGFEKQVYRRSRMIILKLRATI
ncbi:MAG: class I SAM-dependent methyltransferase [Thermoplasmatales archaeon]